MDHLPSIQISGQAGRMDNYCRAACETGARPVPGCCPSPDLSCAGLILCGGGDMDPTLFGQENRGSQPPDRQRDQAELELFWAFFQAGKPILAICRGMQVVNVALGGTLLQDLPGEIRPFHGGGEEDRVHPVRSREGTLLHRLYGPIVPVNSAHHQAVDRLGEGLETIAWAESGFPEALIHTQRPVLGVQFHPERMSFDQRRGDAVDGAPIFQYFMDLCRG